MKDLIVDFVERVSASGEIDREWRAFIEARRATELDAIIADEGLKPSEIVEFIERAFQDGAIITTGTALTSILPPLSRFSEDDSHGEKKGRVLSRLREFFERFFGLSSDA